MTGLDRLRTTIDDLAVLRGRPAVVLCATIDDDLVSWAYQALAGLGRTDRLDVVLSTTGGSVSSGRQLALLLREYADHVSVLVPRRARSAGTLVCLSADELVLDPLGELSPVDSNMAAEGLLPQGGPAVISSEDVKAFPEMARSWFGVRREEDNVQVLAILAQRIFPTTLASFYRLDKLARETALELLLFQRPDEADAEWRSATVDKLVSGYHAHDVALSRRDLLGLGLAVVPAEPAAEQLLARFRDIFDSTLRQLGDVEQVVGIVATADLQARHVLRAASPDPSPDSLHRPDGDDEAGTVQRLESVWVT